MSHHSRQNFRQRHITVSTQSGHGPDLRFPRRCCLRDRELLPRLLGLVLDRGEAACPHNSRREWWQITSYDGRRRQRCDAQPHGSAAPRWGGCSARCSPRDEWQRLFRVSRRKCCSTSPSDVDKCNSAAAILQARAVHGLKPKINRARNPSRTATTQNSGAMRSADLWYSFRRGKCLFRACRSSRKTRTTLLPDLDYYLRAQPFNPPKTSACLS